MRGLTSQSLHLFDDPSAGSAEQPALAASAGLSREEQQRAEWHACRETWRPYPPRRPTSGHEPYTLPWFRQIEERRYARHGRWIPKLFEFTRHRGEHVLCLGDGLGTDWCRFAEGGAHVTFATAAAKQLPLVRRNFELRGLRGQFVHAPSAALPLPNGSMDVAVLSDLGGLAGDRGALVNDVFRVLKPGGKVLAAVLAKYDARWWQDFWFPWLRWLKGPAAGDEARYSGRGLRQLLGRFAAHRVVKRHLRRSDIPHIWRWMLLPFLERIMGRYLIVRAFKPLLATAPVRAAA